MAEIKQGTWWCHKRQNLRHRIVGVHAIQEPIKSTVNYEIATWSESYDMETDGWSWLGPLKEFENCFVPVAGPSK